MTLAAMSFIQGVSRYVPHTGIGFTAAGTTNPMNEVQGKLAAFLPEKIPSPLACPARAWGAREIAQPFNDPFS